MARPHSLPKTKSTTQHPPQSCTRARTVAVAQWPKLNSPALAVGLVREKSVEDTIRFAAAAGTLNVTRQGLGTGRIEDIEALSRQVQLRLLREEFGSAPAAMSIRTIWGPFGK